jgi:hypothetical protein
MKTAKLRYEGRFDFINSEDNRLWTILDHWIGPDGADYYRSSRMRKGLIQLGIVREVQNVQ